VSPQTDARLGKGEGLMDFCREETPTAADGGSRGFANDDSANQGKQNKGSCSLGGQRPNVF